MLYIVYNKMVVKCVMSSRAQDESPTLLPRQILKEKAFYILWTVFLLNGQGIIFISTLYKVTAVFTSVWSEM